MKAKSIAALLSLVVATIPVHAEVIASKHSQAAKSSTLTHKINLNQASLSTLIGSIKGIGKKRAQAIIAYRQEHKGFKSLEELAEVKGFGKGFMVKNNKKLTETFEVS